ncbi:hypothetical protein CBR_g16088 [Chara braunii]|uniref:Uncharacterized protein n=1 Tax=Chara braunii TaxID=69332 RepID=A0A388KTW3_CHABU|nr:hypothetical protein CBR_g16088 [Chara braunii]|eukprot:GBG73373.1 hypothetical protein CBR_g16088 [Chara braunii]
MITQLKELKDKVESGKDHPKGKEQVGGCHNRFYRHKVTKDNFRDRGTVKDMVRGEMEEEEMTMEEEDLEKEELVDKEKEDPFVRVEEVDELSDQLKIGVKISEEGENMPLVEIEPEEDNEVRESARETLGRMEDMIDKMGRLNIKMSDICEEVRNLKMKMPHVFTMSQGKEDDGPRDHNPIALRATLAAGSEAAYQALMNFVPHTPRRPKGGNAPKETTQAPVPPQGGASIEIEEEEEEEQDELPKEEEER